MSRISILNKSMHIRIQFSWYLHRLQRKLRKTLVFLRNFLVSIHRIPWCVELDSMRNTTGGDLLVRISLPGPLLVDMDMHGIPSKSEKFSLPLQATQPVVSSDGQWEDTCLPSWVWANTSRKGCERLFDHSGFLRQTKPRLMKNVNEKKSGKSYRQNFWL